MTATDRRPVAIVTGASRGLGAALARRLAEDGWALVLDARGEDALAEVLDGLAGGPHASVSGDVADPVHRRRLVALAEDFGGLDALVNNASHLGPSPQPALADYPVDELRRVYEVNVIAPLALAAEALPALRSSKGRVVNITSDASVEAYESWGGYGSSKAALDHATRVLAAEEPEVRVYAVDPGDLRTAMHQAAFPGEDISDRPEPATVVPHLMALVLGDVPSGRIRAADLTPVHGVVA
jgi:NAD(P)-dependent dehydrogenase (short-subunit alcohol dehydrogenase family)